MYTAASASILHPSRDIHPVICRTHSAGALDRTSIGAHEDRSQYGALDRTSIRVGGGGVGPVNRPRAWVEMCVH
jgi:hypothetical protein